MILWFQEKVDVLESREASIRSVSEAYPAPAVLRMKKYIPPRRCRHVRLSRDNIFIRDNHQCQFCGDFFSYRDLTLDHVMPVSRGGGKSWENLVAACRGCNHKKGNQTPKEAKMPLLKKPAPLRWVPHLEVSNKISNKNEDDLWSPYLSFL